jgi:hydrogenase maturation protease
VKLVIGYGNPLREDDGAGRLVAERLDAEGAGVGVTVVAAHQLTPEMAEPIARAKIVVFVDARLGDGPGTVASEAVGPEESAATALSHDVDPPALLALARALYGACPPAAVVSVGAARIGYGIELSEEVRAAIPIAMDRVRAILRDGVAA